MQRNLQGLRQALESYHQSTTWRPTLFIVIGEQGSGKSSLIQASGYNFIDLHQITPELADEMKSSWWISPEAVFYELPATLFHENSHPDQERLWRYFIEEFKKLRLHHSLQGIIALSSVDLLRTPHESRPSSVAFHRLLHDVQYLTKQPLQLFFVLNKIDLIKGFREFFADPDLYHHHQTFSIRLPYAGPVGTPKIDKAFTRSFDLLVQNLYQKQLIRLHHEKNPLARSAVFEFPLQFETLKTPLRNFLLNILMNVRLKNADLVGFYFVSAKQQGQPFDHFEKTLDQCFDLESKTAETSPLVFSSQTYFVGEFFNRLLRDKNLDRRPSSSLIHRLPPEWIRL